MLVLVGLPGAGKSTLVDREIVDPRYFIVTAWRSCPDYRIVEEVKAELVEVAYGHGKEPVIDATNLSRKVRTPLVRSAKIHGDRAICVFVDLPAAEAERRYRGRRERSKNTLEYNILVDLLEPPAMEEGFEEIIVIKMSSEDSADGLSRLRHVVEGTAN